MRSTLGAKTILVVSVRKNGKIILYGMNKPTQMSEEKKNKKHEKKGLGPLLDVNQGGDALYSLLSGHGREDEPSSIEKNGSVDS